MSVRNSSICIIQGSSESRQRFGLVCVLEGCLLGRIQAGESGKIHSQSGRELFRRRRLCSAAPLFIVCRGARALTLLRVGVGRVSTLCTEAPLR